MPVGAGQVATLVDLLRWRSSQQPDQIAFTILQSGAASPIELSYAELDRQARAIGGLLQQAGATGQRAMLLYPPGHSYIAALFGCLYAGVIAVPAYPPRATRPMPRLQSIVADAHATLALTTGDIFASLEERLAQTPDLAALRWLTTDSCDPALATAWQSPMLPRESLALLQYTSGSTAAPKGVMLSHDNLLQNLALIQQCFETTADSRGVFWLPPYHDMGLIGGILQPLYCGGTATLMSPLAFLQRPLRWLETISETRATISGAPNFAYDLCIAKTTPEQRSRLDLSSWELAFTGAEPVRAATLEQFAMTFAAAGFRREAFYPCYGLAEATLLVTGGRKDAAPVVRAFASDALAEHRVVASGAEDRRELVGCGVISASQQLAIVDPERSTPLPPDQIGEIWVAGPSVAQGYWNNAALTQQTFGAYLAESGAGPFLRTGDLGFLQDGELFVTGRIKDLIIIRGRNHYPQDIELAVEQSHSALRPGSGAAVSVEVAGEERLVIIHEIERSQYNADLVAVIERMRLVLAEQQELQAHAVMLIKAGTLPRTSSGKVQRHACRADFLAGRLQEVAAWRETLPGGEVAEAEPVAPALPAGLEASEAEIAGWLARRFAATLKLDMIALDRPVAGYGIDSLSAVELAHAAEEQFGVALSLEALLQGATVADLAAQIAALGESVPEHVDVEPMPDAGLEHPLSVGQRALWFLHQLAPESTAYHISTALRVRSGLDEAALRDSLQILAMRHAALRSTFAQGSPAIEGLPVQRIHEQPQLAITVVDAAAWTAELLKERISAATQQPFDLQYGPLWRVHLFLLRPSEYILLFTIHHIIADFWSLTVLAREFDLLYPQLIAGHADPSAARLAPGSIQYADYVRWQTAWLASPEGEQSWAYWQRQLRPEGSQSLPVLDLPTDYPRPAVQTYEGAAYPFDVPTALGDELKALSAAHGVTLYMTLLAALYVVLGAYTGQSDLLVGSPMAGRRRARLARLVGYLTNPVVLRVDLARTPSFTALLAQVRETVLAASAHQEFPFAALVDRLQPERDPSRSPLFQVMFVFQKPQALDSGLSALALGREGTALTLGGMQVEPVSLERQIAQFDLTLNMAEVDGRLLATIEYNRALFAPETIARLADHLLVALTTLAAAPDRALSRISLLTPAERQQMLIDWNRSGAEYPRDAAIHQLIEAQAERTPDTVAIVFEDASLSYAELNERANRLAHYLRAQGVGPDVLVALCVERSLEMIVGMLAILKAGGAYVPLDPAYPAERLQYMLSHSQASVILTQAALVENLRPEGTRHQARVFRLDADWDTLAGEPSSNPPRAALPDNLAYVIYTSGSTGRPKGVMVTQRGVLNLVYGLRAYFDDPAVQITGLITSISFDISVNQIFPTLIFGRALHIISDPVKFNSRALLRYLDEHRIHLLDAVPSYLQAVLNEVAPEQFANALRYFLIGGEKLEQRLLHSVFGQLGSQLEVVNIYGLTEITDLNIVGAIRPDELDKPVTAGRPLQNNRIYILDVFDQPQPIGITGEVCVSGESVSRGYLFRPDLTAERFVACPLEDGRIMVRTGDLGRWRSDGTVEILGRIDHQVKVRGFRIETSEIEAVLAQYPSVNECVVVVREDRLALGGYSDKRLVAYLAPRHGMDAPGVEELRQLLGSQLPNYMVPGAFVLLDALPRTSNGKIDRKALPEPQPERSEIIFASSAPQTPAQQALAGIWSEVLGIEQIGIYDNFFALGGDSILGMLVVSKARQDGLQFTPRQLFQHQTIAELAAVVGTTQPIQAEQGLISGTAPLTPIQHWLFTQAFSQPQHWNQALLLDLRAALDPLLLEAALQHLVQHHDALRLRFTCQGGQWQQRYAEREEHSLVTVVDLAALPEQEHSAALAQHASQAQATLDLNAGPLLRAVLFGLGASGARLLLVIHHLAVDGVSWRILLADLQTAYQQLQSGAPLVLPAKTTAFKHWAERLQDFAQSPELHADYEFWRSRPWTELAPLPLDHQAETALDIESSSQTVNVGLSPEDTRVLLHEVPQSYSAQITDLLLAALVEALADWTGRRTLLVDLEGHGRADLFGDVDLSRTVGWFTSIFPLVLDIRSAHGPDALLKAVKEQLRRIPRQGIGYGLLRYQSQDHELRTELAALPQAEILFNYLGQFDPVLPDGGPFGLSQDGVGATRSPHNRRTHRLEINAFVVNQRLRLNWTFSSRLHDEATIAGLADRWLHALHSLIAHCLAGRARGYTPSDFALANIDQAQLDRISRDQIIADLYPLSPMQQGMLFHTLSAPASGVYVQQLICALHGELDVAAFGRAWQHVVDQHPVLRTGLLWEDLAQPLQLVQPQVTLPLAQLDWRDRSAAEQSQELAAYLRVDREQGFDLRMPPLLRLALIRTGADDYRLVWSYHHSLLDGWSMPLIFRQVLSAYQATTLGQDVQIAESRPYHDYIAWLQEQDLQAAERFWRTILRGFHGPTPLTVDRAGSGDQSADSGYGAHTLALTEELTEALQTLARQQQLTINTIVQGVWALLLSRYSGERDVVFGATVSGRPAALAGSDAMIGLFINTLPVRVAIGSESELLIWLRELQQQLVALREFEATPLPQIQSWSDVPRGQPLFESVVVFENYPMDALLAEQGGTLRLGQFQMIEQTNYPLTVVVVPEPLLQVTISYDRQRFDEETIARVQQHLFTLLQAIIDNPARYLDELAIISPAEREQMLQGWNATQVSYPQDVCLHTLIAAQAARTPEAIAVGYEDRTLTYRELDRRANQLAQLLRRHGVGGCHRGERSVGVCLERSLELVVALLAVLKAGGAYVALDPEYPLERLQFMLKDAQAPVLLTQERLVESLSLASAQVICLDSTWAAIDAEPDVAPVSDVSPEGVAYVIYTSGSTGRPKGVMNTHRGIVNRLLWMQDMYRLDARDRVLQKTPYSFDVSVWEFFWPLLTGARLVLARPGGHRDSAYLADLIAAQRITTLHFVPSMLQAFLEEPDLARCRSLRRVICSGEALSFELQQRFFARLDAELHNLYGPTEAAVDVTYWACERSTARRSVPIGRPVANTQIYLLDAQLEPVPIGIPGELYIGGVQLARGYLNRPDLTAEKFVPDPFSAEPNARLYRTGDLARYRADGAIEYLGRIDHQVKVRGFRIELGEIESTLLEHPGVRDAVVVARPNAQGLLRLVAYIVAEPRTKNLEPTENHAESGSQFLVLGSSDLRTFLQERLPDYMVPSAFVALDALPLTPNGKLDRRALPEPGALWAAERPNSADGLSVPQSSAETALAMIWREVLGVEQIGIHDNFFALGGDSILSLLVVSKAQQAGLRLTPRQLFQHQTIAELAAVAVEAPQAQAQQEPVIGPVPLTPIQHWFFEQNGARPQHWNQALLLNAEQPLDPALVEQTLRYLLIHHDALRLRFTRAASWEQFSPAFDEAIPLQVFDLADLNPAECEATIAARAAELQGSLDLHAGPLMRAGLWLRGAEAPSVLVIVLHHLVVDGVSWQILLEDFQRAYRELAEGRRPVLPPKTTSFKAWAERLAAIDTIPAQELDYWREIAGGTRMILPVDVAGANNTEALARTVSVGLDAEETRVLLQEAAQSYKAGINDLLLAALALALHQWTGARALLVDLEGHGRNSGLDDVDLSRTVGWLTTLFPVSLAVDAGDDPAALVLAIKAQLRRVPQSGRHYGVIRYLDRYPELAAELRSAPQAEILFNYLGQSRQLLQPGSLFAHVQPAPGPARSPESSRRYLLEINGIVVDGCLSFDWIYGSAVHHEATIAAVAHSFIAALRAILALRNSPSALRLTPADVPQARISGHDLDTIRDQIDRRGGRIADVYELTPLQQGMLFHALYAPASGVYVEQLVCTMQGDFKLDVFSAAWRMVAERHAVLRTTFCWQDLEKPLQVVLPEIDVDLSVEDWRAISPAARHERLAAWLKADRVRGFEPGQAPLFRLALFQHEAQTCQFVLTHHHLLLDGWSLSRIVQEAFALYNGLNRNQPPLLPGSRPFRDYIAWLQAREDVSAETFWRAALSGFAAPSRVLGDRGAPDDTTQREDAYAEMEIACAAETTAALQSLARSERLTLNTIVQGAWALLLSRYGDTSDVLFGTTVAGRPTELSGVESMVGLFANTLPLRVQIDASAALEDWLRQLQSQQAEWREYEHTSLVAIQGWSDVPRGLPLFESLLVFENYPSSAHLRSESGLDVVDLRFVGGRTNYPLTFLVLPGPMLQLRLIYDRERFDENTASHLLNQLRTMLSDISSRPEQPVSALPLLQTATLTIAATFTAEPVAESLSFWLQELDLPARIEFAPYNQVFQQLLDPASQAATNRRGLNVALIRFEDWLDAASSETIAPVLERNLADLIAAVRQAASRWQVPLLLLLCPPSAVILSDAALRADFMAREQRVVAELAGVSGVSVLTSTELLALYPVADYDDPHADALGHVPYTEALFAALGTLIARKFSALGRSPAKVIALDCDNTLWRGVCGEDGPLGVAIDPPRRALQEFIVERQQAGWLICLCSKNNEADALEVFDRRDDMPLKREHLVGWQINWRAKSENLRVLAQKLQLGLDSFIFIDDNPLECAEVAANCSEALVLQLPIDDARIPEVLSHFWAFDQAARTREDASRTAMYQAQSQREDLRQSAATLEDFLSRLELQVDIAPLQAQYLDRTAQLTQRTNQFNLTTIRRSQSEVQQSQRDGAEWLVVHVRDRFGDYGLVGAIMFTVGETALLVDTLLLSCRAMGRGVEHRMVAALGELALERGLSLVELRFTPTVKNRPTADFLAEIGQSYRHTTASGESFRLPAEVAAQVAYRPGSAAPAAAPVAEIGQPAPTTVARFQAAQLQRIAHELDRPDLVLAQLRSRLRSRPTAADSYTAPRTDVETLLAEMWADVLRLERVGAHDHFFALGGHSLLATQIASRIYETFGVALPLRALFEAPTVAELGEQILLARQSAGQSLPFERVPPGEPPRLSYAQERLWLLAQLDPESPAYNIPVAMRLQGTIDPVLLERSLNEVVARHAVLRTTFADSPLPSGPGSRTAPKDGPHPVQVIAPSLWVALPLVDLSAQPEPELAAQQWIVEESRRPFDLAHDPPLRPALLRLHSAQPEHILLLTLHHIAADGWSMGVLIREMVACYTSLSANLPPSLPDLRWQYADYAYWQRRWLAQGSPSVLDQLTGYWARQLAGAPTVLDLRTDRPRPEVQSSQGAHLAHTLPAELLDHLLTLSRGEGATLFMVLLAALNVLLHHETGLDDLVVGSDVANRNRAETEPLIGFFVNQLVLRTSVAGNPTFQALLRRVRDTALDAYAHQDIPFDKLVAALKQERSFKYAPVFQVKLVLQNAPLPEIDLPGLTLQPLPVDLGTSQLDLNIRALQTPEGLLLSAEYNTDLFDPGTIAQLLRQLEAVLRAVAAQPDRSLDALSAMLAEADQRYRSSKKVALKASSLQNLRQTKRRSLRDTPASDADEHA